MTWFNYGVERELAQIRPAHQTPNNKYIANAKFSMQMQKIYFGQQTYKIRSKLKTDSEKTLNFARLLKHRKPFICYIVDAEM